jgi:hypothetical protein
MHDVGGVWRKEMVWRFKAGAPTLPIRPCLDFIPRSFEQALVTIHRPLVAFLPGSGSHSEFDVTYSKQTMARFLPGSRIRTTHSIRREDSSHFRAQHSVCAAKSSYIPPNSSRNFCTDFFFA